MKQMMVHPVEGMAAIQRAIDSVSHYLVLKNAISVVTGLAARPGGYAAAGAADDRR